jgi:hypothetical protein
MDEASIIDDIILWIPLIFDFLIISLVSVGDPVRPSVS